MMTPLEARLTEEVAALRAENERLKQHNEVLRLKVDAMARRLFGKSSEKLDPAQLQMVFEALERGEGDDPAKKPWASGCSDAESSEVEDSTSAGAQGVKRKKRSLDELLAGLPVTEVVVEPEEVKADPDAWACIGEERTKLIDYTPGKFSA